MNQKRLRIFAGPNGSGKSTFIRDFPTTDKRTLGFYVNADDIEQLLNKNFSLELHRYGISSTTEEIRAYFKNSTFSPVKLQNENLWKNFSIENNTITIDKGLSINSYIAADIAEFIRQHLLKSGLSFSYETVMSDEKKIEFLKLAKKEGYRIYLYFFATEDPMININRVKLRVEQHGHSVKEDVIVKRYYRSLNNLREAVLVSDRAYLFDTSKALSLLSVKVTGKEVQAIDPKNIPFWVSKYLYKLEI